MNALSTMLLISDAFVELCDEMPLRKVSISDIVERTGKNRKTCLLYTSPLEVLLVYAQERRHLEAKPRGVLADVVLEDVLHGDVRERVLLGDLAEGEPE